MTLSVVSTDTKSSFAEKFLLQDLPCCGCLQSHCICAGAGFLVNCSRKIEGFYLLCSGNLWISYLVKCKHAPVCAKE